MPTSVNSQMNHNPRWVNYVSVGSGGHRSDYDRVLTAELRAHNINLLRIESAHQAADPNLPLLYSMLDSNVLAFLGTAAMRSARKRTTVGLFFRPGECFLTTSLRYRMKRTLFQIASRLPHVSILTLMPFSIFPPFAEVATGWIYDPQLWDLLPLGFIEDRKLPILDAHLGDQSNGRPILIALGKQEQAKGFDYLVDLWCSSPKVREAFICIVAGKVHESSIEAAARFVQHGGILIDRHISDEELMHLYRCADAIWSCYAPEYNQASGIFGRAIQFGVPVIVRKESFLENLGRLLLHPTLPIPVGSESDAAELLLHWQPKKIDAAERMPRLNEMRAFSTSVLINSLVDAQPTNSI